LRACPTWLGLGSGLGSGLGFGFGLGLGSVPHQAVLDEQRNVLGLVLLVRGRVRVRVWG